jgi:plastocyanin
MNKVYKRTCIILGFGVLFVSLVEASSMATTANLENAVAQIAPRIPAAKNQILMGDPKSGLYAYEPNQLTIKEGETVTFRLAGVGPHNVIFDEVPGNDKALTEKLSRPKLVVQRGESVAVSFEGMPKGVYSFHCAPHKRAGMKGTITVQ